MKVKHLIKNSIWIQGSSYDLAIKPKVSVLLPTFRRAKNGLFRRCVESILKQTLKDIELIIIDDASIDGTAEQIDEFMQKDGRVSCIRHVTNIGLPAISEYEGFVRARADRLAFAFDDNVFNESALEELFEASEKKPFATVFGHIMFNYIDTKNGELIKTRLGTNQSLHLLKLGNFIPNNAVMIPKFIIEDVGFYDPHVLMARICDWDLWIRIAKQYEVNFVDTSVGIEDGNILADSLGNTYTLDNWAVSEWMTIDRNLALRPSNFLEYDVFSNLPKLGLSTNTSIQHLAYKHASVRNLSIPLITPKIDSSDGYILLVTADYNASVNLCWDMLPHTISSKVRIINFLGAFGLEEIARATLIVFVRQINIFETWINAARTLGIPIYLYLDDNLPLLVEKGEICIENENYSPYFFRRQMNLFEGVLLTSKKLIEYFEEQLFHNNLIYFPVSCIEQKIIKKNCFLKNHENEIVIAMTGGPHRERGFWEIAFPALLQLAEEGILINIITTKPCVADYDQVINNSPKNLRITLLPYHTHYLSAIQGFYGYSPDFMIHPPSNTINNPFKTLNAVLSARLMNAVAVLPSIEPYTQIANKGNAILVEDPFKPLSWYQTMKKTFTEGFDRKALLANNIDYCQQEFSGLENERVLVSILQRHGGEVNLYEQSRRLHQITQIIRNNNNQTVNFNNTNVSLTHSSVQELAAYRRMIRYSWRHRMFRKKSDLWSEVDVRFLSLKKASQDAGWRKANSSLELSESLHDIPYREYKIHMQNGNISGISFAFTTDKVGKGYIGVELVNPNGKIYSHLALDIENLIFSEPVKFNIPNLKVNQGDLWQIRLFAKSLTPVYVFEFINRKYFGLHFESPTPFMQIHFQK